MKINVWGINYSPELTGIAVYNAGMCDYLAEQGDEVTMVCGFPYYPSWRKAEADQLALFRNEKVGDVLVCRCWQYVPAKPSAWRRVLHELSFALTSLWRQLTLAPPDIYIVVSPPLLLGLAAWLISSIKRRPFLFHVQDLQPDSALSLSMLPRFLSKFLYSIERFSYDRAKIVSGISLEMLDAFRAKGVDVTKILLFPNWVDLKAESNSPASGTWKSRRHIPEQTRIVSYAGNMGVKQGLEIAIEAVKQLRDRTDILFVLAGDGAQKSYLLKIVNEAKLTNVLMLPVLPESEYVELLKDSDICLITQLPGTGASFFPSKLLKILSMGRAVITNADEKTTLYAQIVQAGFGVPAGINNDGGAFASAIVDLLENADLRFLMGENGRRYVAQFERKQVLSAFRQALAGSDSLSERQREHTLARR